jgi:hypothetical protein
MKHELRTTAGVQALLKTHQDHTNRQQEDEDMGNSFSIFITSPQEHASQFWEKDYRRESFLEQIPCRRG